MKKPYKEHLKTNKQARTSLLLGILFLLISIAVTIYFISSTEEVIIGGIIVWLTISYAASIGLFIHSNYTNK